MILVSKILTLNKRHILENLFLEPGEVESSRVDYFALGNPIIDPPRVRGSIILQLNKKFITDNIKYFVYGSPIDIGSIKFGFFKPVGNADLFIENITCNHQKFINLLDDLEKLPDKAINRIMNHKHTFEARSILEKYFNSDVVNFMFDTIDPHAWMFEFSVKGPYSLCENHIESILYPNTYSETILFGSLYYRLWDKLREYNPKYEMEQPWI